MVARICWVFGFGGRRNGPIHPEGSEMGRFDNRRRHIEVLRLRSVSRGREGSPRVSSVIGGGGGGAGAAAARWRRFVRVAAAVSRGRER